MLITKEQIEYATTLNRLGVVNAMNRGGYLDEDIQTATFLGMNNVGQFIYKITYNGGEGNVYLDYVANEDGRLELQGDY